MVASSLGYLNGMVDEFGIHQLEPVGECVFVSGIPRSGTTACQHLLAESLSFEWRRSLRQEVARRAVAESFYWESASSPENDEFLERKIAFLGGCTKYVDFYNYVFNNRMRWGRPVSDVDMASVYFNMARMHYNTTIPCEKTPSNILFSDDIFAAFPNAVILFLVRHPYDVCASFRLRQIVEGEVETWVNQEVEQICWYYKYCVDVYYNKKMKYKNRIILLKFEDMVANATEPIGLLNRVIDGKRFLHEPSVVVSSGNSSSISEEILKSSKARIIQNILEGTAEFLKYKL